MLKADPSSFKAPHLNPSAIQKIVEDFSAKYWASDIVPVDIYKIAEFGLNLEIIPKRDFYRSPGIEALLLGDGTAIMVDAEQFEDEKYENRMRFSFAHELGHKVMHSNIYEEFCCETVEDWIELIQTVPESEYNWLEYQANEFAGRLLVPTNKLAVALKPFDKTVRSLIDDHGITDLEMVGDFIAPRISKHFAVSEQVIARRIHKEGLIKV